MPLATILTRFTEGPVKFDGTQERSVLTKLKMVYEGGSLDGKAANFPTRDVSAVVAGVHCGNRHFFETYKRTIWINVRNGRTIFRCAGLTARSNNSSWWRTLLAVLRIRKLRSVVI
jgi:hypothetical protein